VSTGAVVNAFFELLEGLSAVVRKVPGDIFSGEPHEGNCNLRVSVNEPPIEIGKPKEGHDVLDLPGFQASPGWPGFYSRPS